MMKSHLNFFYPRDGWNKEHFCEGCNNFALLLEDPHNLSNTYSNSSAEANRTPFVKG